MNARQAFDKDQQPAFALGAQWAGLPAYVRRSIWRQLEGTEDPAFELARTLLAAVAAEHMRNGTTDEESARRLLAARNQ